MIRGLRSALIVVAITALLSVAAAGCGPSGASTTTSTTQTTNPPVAGYGLLTVASTSLVVELGVSLDVLLAVLVLQVLTGRMRDTFGDTDLDELRELHD